LEDFGEKKQGNPHGSDTASARERAQKKEKLFLSLLAKEESEEEKETLGEKRARRNVLQKGI